MSSTQSNSVATFQPQISLPMAIWIFALASLFLFYIMVIQVSPGVMKPMLSNDLNISLSQVALISAAYYLPYTVMQIPAGLIIDRFQLRTAASLPLLLFTLAVMLFSITESAQWATLSRQVMGFGGAFAFISVLVIASDVFPKRYFAMFAGVAQFIASMGGLCGAAPLLILFEQYGWRQSLNTISLLGVGLAVLMWFFLKIDRKHDELVTEHSGSITDIIFKSQTWYLAIYAFCLWAPMVGFAAFWGNSFLENVHHLTKLESSKIMSVMWLGVAIVPPLLGFVSDAMSKRKLLMTICALVGGACFSCVLFMAPLSYLQLEILLFIAGAACSGQVLTFALVRENNQPQNQATALGINNMAVVIPGLIIQPLIAFLMEWRAGDVAQSIAVYSRADYIFGMSVILVTYLFGFVVSALLIQEKN